MNEDLEKIKEERARADVHADSKAIESILGILHSLTFLPSKMEEVLKALHSAKEEATDHKTQLNRVTGKIETLESELEQVKTDVNSIRTHQSDNPAPNDGIYCKVTGRLMVYILLAIGGFIFLGAAITLAALGLWSAEDIRSFLTLGLF